MTGLAHPTGISAQIIEHAIDNHVRPADYDVLAVLETPRDFSFSVPDPCDILPRQFGFWFHIGPGFGPLVRKTYAYKLLHTRNACILGKDGVPVFAGGWVDTSYLHYSRGHLPGCQFKRESDRIIAAAPVRTLTGRHFMGFNAGHNNYAHFLTDQVSILWHYRQNFMADGVRLLMPKGAAAFVTAYLRLLDIPPDLIDLIGDEVVQVEDVILPSFYSFDAIPYATVNMLGAFRDSLSLKPAAGRRIFISRRETSARPLLNEDSLTARLQHAGFDVIVPGTMTVEAQIQAFSDAEVVVGCHGAAMANIVYCRPGTRVLELFPEYTVSPHFWMLASHFGLRYGTAFGTSFDWDMALQDQMGSWGAPFVIDERVIARYLAALPAAGGMDRA